MLDSSPRTEQAEDVPAAPFTLTPLTPVHLTATHFKTVMANLSGLSVMQTGPCGMRTVGSHHYPSSFAPAVTSACNVSSHPAPQATVKSLAPGLGMKLTVELLAPMQAALGIKSFSESRLAHNFLHRALSQQPLQLTVTTVTH